MAFNRFLIIAEKKKIAHKRLLLRCSPSCTTANCSEQMSSHRFTNRSGCAAPLLTRRRCRCWQHRLLLALSATIIIRAEFVCDHSPDEQKLRDGAALERHTMERLHGDVCRDAVSGEFFCPLGCIHILDSPYCMQKTRGYPAEACRVPIKTMSRVDMLAARLLELRAAKANSKTPPERLDNQIKLVKLDLRAAKVEAARAPPPPPPPELLSRASDNAVVIPEMSAERACDTARAALRPETKWARGLTSRFEPHASEPFHGDICRTSDGSYFCPDTCEGRTTNPFCVAADNTSSCRINVLSTLRR